MFSQVSLSHSVNPTGGWVGIPGPMSRGGGDWVSQVPGTWGGYPRSHVGGWGGEWVFEVPGIGVDIPGPSPGEGEGRGHPPPTTGIW